MYSKSLRILQINLNRSLLATESTLQLAIELKIDLVLVQEPWTISTITTTRSVVHPAFFQLLPPSSLGTRPRTLAYVTNRLQPLVTISPSSPIDPDFLVLDIINGQSTIQVYNIYNEKDQLGLGPSTLERVLYSTVLGPNSLVLGDFNSHHPWWDPLTTSQSTGASDLVLWLEENRLELINSPGIGTFYRPNMARESVLDLTLATSTLASAISDWQVLPGLGSDYFSILFTINRTDTYLETSQLRFNTKKAD
jgi:Endonuclease-reverse transcriptase